MLDLDEIKKMTDKAYINAQVTRERAADDLVFFHITQWDDNLLSTSDLSYRGEFNILKKSARQIITDLRSNPVQVDFEPIDETRDDSAEILDGLYRADDRRNTSQEAYTNASQETVVCGVGAWELYTDYVSTRSGTKNQVIKRMPIHEANNNVFWDPNAKLLDKSDAMYVVIITPYSPCAYQEMVRDVTGDEDYEASEANFKFPQQSYTFPWTAGNFAWVYVGTVYKRELVTDKIITLMEPMTGDTVDHYESDLEDIMDEMIESGHVIISEKDTERWEVTKYIASGEEILSEDVIAGEHIPVVPVYGERAFVEGQEHWEGITRLAKDPSRLRNFVMSYIADIASRSPRPKPIFFPEQVQGFEDMYEMGGSENNFPYLLQNMTDANNNPLPQGAPSMMPEQPIPSSVATLVGLTREAVEDVAGNAMPRDIMDVDLSGEAIGQLVAQLQQQSHVYQENMKHAKRRDAEIYASMASRVYDVPREVSMAMPDGTTVRGEVMKTIIDDETGEPVVINDLRNAQFEVFSEIGPTYKSQKEQTRKEITMQLQAMAPDDPMRTVMQLAYAELTEGDGMKVVREYAKKQMILQGFKEPDTPEEEQMLQQQAEAMNQPDPAMVLAQAEMAKGQAAMIREQRGAIKDEADVENNKAGTAIDIYEAQTNRFKAETDAEKVGAELDLKRRDNMIKQYQAFTSPLRASASNNR